MLPYSTEKLLLNPLPESSYLSCHIMYLPFSRILLYAHILYSISGIWLLHYTNEAVQNALTTHFAIVKNKNHKHLLLGNRNETHYSSDMSSQDRNKYYKSMPLVSF